VPVETVIAGLLAIVTALSTAVGILWRNHLANDERERKRTETAEADNRAIIAELRQALRKGNSR